MEQRRCQPQRQPKRPAAGQSGFTLIEMVVAIVVLGVLTAAVSVNWASFMRHQELRSDAITLHKEIMALKARAIENGAPGGCNDTCFMLRVFATDSCTVQWFVPDTGNPNTSRRATKNIKFSKGVAIDTTQVLGPNWGDLLQIASRNGWAAGYSKVKIVVMPDNIRAYDSRWGNENAPLDFQGGWLVLSSAKVKARYCIQKDNTGIRPELYYQSKAGGAWTKM